MQQVSVRTNVGGRDSAEKSSTTQGDLVSTQLLEAREDPNAVGSCR